MQKFKMKFLLGLFFIIVCILIPNKVSASEGYTIEQFDIDMIVNEDNTFNITETIVANFTEYKHGIIREIPLKNKLERLDGQTSRSRAKVTNISVNEPYEVSSSFDSKSIQIGESDKTIIGPKTYIIKYTYNLGKDPLKDKDEFYFNLIGTEWYTTISNVSFNISMPKEFDESLLGFSLGGYGSTSNEGIEYTVEGNNIIGNYSGTLGINEGLTVRCELPEGYFVNTTPNLDVLSIIIIIACIIFIIIAFIMWSKFGKEDKVVETVEFYPPEGYNSAEVGFLYKGKAESKDVISLLIYLANKGYLKIRQIENKVLFVKSKSFEIIKLKDYDGNNKNEQIFFNALFSSKDTVTESDLYDRFYVTINKILKNLNSKENREKIFDSSANKMNKWIVMMVLVILALIGYKIYSFDESAMLFMPSLFVVFAIFVVTFGMKGSNNIGAKIFLVFWALMFGGIPFFVFIMPILLEEPMALLTVVVGIVTDIILLVFLGIMPKRNAYGNEILGKLKGFKRFLETAEKEKLESLVEKDPEYFYNILPYTYALGVSEKWMSQFETIAMQAPDWYDYTGPFILHDFNIFLGNTMKSAQTTMTSSPSSSSSGGGFSGGGFSGGGAGGGGGHSW